MKFLKLGEKIRAVRRGKQMTQKKLADLIGCKSSFVSHIERNSRNVSMTYLERIASALGTPAYRLMTSDDDKIARCVDSLSELDPEHLDKAREYLEFLAEKQKKAVRSV